MEISRICGLIIALSLSFVLPAQATTLKNIKTFSSTNTVQYLQNDWNPSDGDTHWGALEIKNMSDLVAFLLDFYGPYVAGSFIVGNDPWETVSIKSLAGEVDLQGTQEMQLLARPRYTTSNPYVSVVLRLTMQDGSIWDQPKVLANNVWGKGVFPVNKDSFARVEWGPEGAFDISKVASWEMILVDLPPNNTHYIDLSSIYLKGNYDAPANMNAAETFGENFRNGDKGILFRHADWNPTDGDTDWLYHLWNQPTSWDYFGYVWAYYRSNNDPWETVSIRKEAQSHFDLTSTGNSQIVALVKADFNLDPNALVMSLTMEDGSIWQQGRPLDVVRTIGSLPGYSDIRNLVSPYRFHLDPSGNGWTRAAWGPTGNFNLTQVKAWELYFNNLGQGMHAVALGSIDINFDSASLIKADNAFNSSGQAQWLERVFSADGVVASINSTGDVGDSLSIAASINGSTGGFTLEISNSYVNTSPDAIVLKLTTKDGKIWQQAYSLPQAGRSILWIYTSCPGLPPGPARPNGFELHCQLAMGPLYGINPADITNWEITLNGPPSGENKIGINLLPSVQ